MKTPFFLLFLVLSGCIANNDTPSSPNSCSCGATRYVSFRTYEGLEITDDYHGVVEVTEITSQSTDHHTWHVKICQGWNACSTYEKDVDGFEIVKNIDDW